MEQTTAKSRTKQSAINAGVSLFARIQTLILGFVSRMIFLRFLSAEYLGVNGLFTNVLTVLSFAELGIGNAIQFSLYKPVKENDREKIASLMRLYKWAYRIIAASVLVVGVALLPVLDLLITEKPAITENLILIYCLFLFNSAASYLFTYKQTLLVADQREYVVTLATSISSVLQNVVHIVILFLTRNFLAYLISTITCNFLTNFIISVIVSRQYSYIKNKDAPSLEKTEKKQIFRDIKALSISKIAGVACNGTDNIIITRMLGIIWVGLVSNYTLIINTMSGLLYSILSGLTGSLGNLNVDKDYQKNRRVFNEIFLLGFFLYSVVGICTIVLVNDFIGEVWLRDEQYLLSLVVVISLVLIGYQSGMNYAAYSFRTTLGYFDQVKYVYVLTAVLNIGLSILLCYWIGLPGIFFATTISKLLTSEIADGYYAYKYGLGLSPIRYYLKWLLHFALYAGNLAACWFTIRLIPLHGLSGFLVKGVACFAMSFAINCIVFCRTEAFRGILFRMRQLLTNLRRRRKKHLPEN